MPVRGTLTLAILGFLLIVFPLEILLTADLLDSRRKGRKLVRKHKGNVKDRGRGEQRVINGVNVT
jgi:hypothetical protein